MSRRIDKFKEGVPVFGFLGCAILVMVGPSLIVAIIVGHFLVKYW